SGVLSHENGLVLARAGEGDKERNLFQGMTGDGKKRGGGVRFLADLGLLDRRDRAAKGKLGDALVQGKGQKAKLSTAREHCLLAMVNEGLGNRAEQRRELGEAMQLYGTLSDKVMAGAWLVHGYTQAEELGKAAQVLEVMKKQADLNNAKQASLMNYLEA